MQEDQITSEGEKRWFVLVDQVHRGPFTRAQIQSTLHHGQLGLNTLVWKAGMLDWEPLTSRLEFDLSAAPVQVSAPLTGASSEVYEIPAALPPPPEAIQPEQAPVPPSYNLDFFARPAPARGQKIFLAALLFVTAFLVTVLTAHLISTPLERLKGKLNRSVAGAEAPAPSAHRYQAAAELSEISDMSDTLDQQFQATNQAFKDGSDWAAFHLRWTQRQSEIESLFEDVTPEVLAREFYHADLYVRLQESVTKIGALHAYQNSTSSSGDNDPTLMDLSVAAQASLLNLRAYLLQAEQAQN